MVISWSRTHLFFHIYNGLARKNDPPAKTSITAELLKIELRNFTAIEINQVWLTCKKYTVTAQVVYILYTNL